MGLVLYRKYRPGIFADVVGQEHVVRTLQNAVKYGRVAHAYLFSGPRGTGKTTVARLLAKAVNCITPKGIEPCQACEHCEEVLTGSSLDLIEIDAASNRGIDEIRELREVVRFAPSKVKHKIFIIDEVHMLTTPAFNALLKTLEEPPAHVIFILATTEPHKVPATILSRVQRFDFHRLSVAVIAKRLATLAAAEKAKIDAPARELIATAAEGSMRDAESMLGQLISAGDKKITTDMVRDILGIVDYAAITGLVSAFIDGNAPAMLRTIYNLQEIGQDLQRFTQELCRYLRGVRMLQESEDLAEILQNELPESTMNDAKAHASSMDSSTVSALLEGLLEAQTLMGRASVMQLPLELALLNSLHEQRIATTAAPSSEEGAVAEISESPEEVKATKEVTVTKAKKTKKNELFADGDLTVDAVKGAWAQVLDDIRPYNNALHAFLQASEICEVTKDNCLRLVVAYDFHKERLAVPRHRKVLLDILKDVLGRPITLEVSVESNSGGVVSSALKMLGGRLVK